MEKPLVLIVKYKWLSAWFLVFSLAYLAESSLAAPDKMTLAKYHITAGQALAATLTVAIPYIVIWFIALVGYLRLKDYTRSIRDSQDGEAFAVLTRGILLLTLWLPISAVLSGAITDYYRVHPSATSELVRLNNYANLLMLFPGFLIINRGAQQLLALVKRPVYHFSQKASMLYISLAALYVFLTLHDPARAVPTQSVSIATYYLPDWATVVTIIIPRLIMWFLGIQAIYFVYLYSRKIKGTLYKQALDRLARGLAWVVTATIVLRCFQSLSTQLSHLNLSLILLVIYALLVLISVGYVLIAKGAKSLQRIEEI